MEDKEKFPSSFEEFYKRITELNKNNKLKINKEVARKYHDYIKEIKGGPPSENRRFNPNSLTEERKQLLGKEIIEHLKKRPTTEKEFKNEIFNCLIGSIKTLNKNSASDFLKNCPNCNNPLIYTRGHSRKLFLDIPSKGGYCLNCGKSFVTGFGKFKEIEWPLFENPGM